MQGILEVLHEVFQQILEVLLQAPISLLGAELQVFQCLLQVLLEACNIILEVSRQVYFPKLSILLEVSQEHHG